MATPMKDPPEVDDSTPPTAEELALVLALNDQGSLFHRLALAYQRVLAKLDGNERIAATSDAMIAVINRLEGEKKDAYVRGRNDAIQEAATALRTHRHEHAAGLTPSEEALAKVLAALASYPEPARLADGRVAGYARSIGMMWAVACAVGDDMWDRSAHALTSDGQALLDRARRAGVL